MKSPVPDPDGPPGCFKITVPAGTILREPIHFNVSQRAVKEIIHA